MILGAIGTWVYNALGYVYGAVKAIFYAFGECFIDIIEAIFEMFSN